jgi:hypothetical protein
MMHKNARVCFRIARVRCMMELFCICHQFRDMLYSATEPWNGTTTKLDFVHLEMHEFRMHRILGRFLRSCPNQVLQICN